MQQPVLAFGAIALFAAAGACAAANAVVTSPDGRNVVTIDTDKLTYAVARDGSPVIAPSPLGLGLDIGTIGAGAVPTGAQNRSVDDTYAIVVGKASRVRDRYNLSTLSFRTPDGKLRFDLVVRAYDNGVALRYAVPQQAGVTGFRVIGETTQFNFPRDYACWGANIGRFDTSFEAEYDALAASKLRNFHNYMSPLVCQTGRGTTTFAIAESDLEGYPGLYLSGRSDGGLGVGVTLPPRFDNDRNRRFKQTVAAKVDLARQPFQTPWRVVMLGDTPGSLAASALIPTLGAPSRVADTGWIRAAKTSWDWWNDWAVDIPGAGINTATYKAFVDFSKAMKLENILIDEGWSVGSDVEPNPAADVTRAIPALDMPALLDYARGQGVGVWLWLQWQQLDAQMDAAFSQYEKWGIKGVKVDFINRNDQEAVAWYHKVLEKAARHKLMVDLHGAFPPSGLNRTWPNYVTQEGVLGAENNKWSRRITATHNVTLPFTRMILGPMDYTPGGFRNVAPDRFAPRNHRPQVMTTRGQALAMYVVYDSPLQMVADSPDAYRNADGGWADGARFVQDVPATWDETIVPAGEIGKYVVSVRRKGDTWYVGAMTNEQGRKLQVPLGFLGAGRFEATVLEDGAAPDRLRTSARRVARGDTLTLGLAPSGGAVAVIRALR